MSLEMTNTVNADIRPRALTEKKKTYTFVTDSENRATFDDPDSAIAWALDEVPDEAIVDIIVEEVDG